MHCFSTSAPIVSALLLLLSTSTTAHVIRSVRHVNATTVLSHQNTTFASHHHTYNASAFNLTSTDYGDECDGNDASDTNDAATSPTISATDPIGNNAAALNATASYDDGDDCDTDDSSYTSATSESDTDDDEGCDEEDDGTASDPDSTSDAVISVTSIASITASPSIGAVINAAEVSASITESSSSPVKVAPLPAMTPAASPSGNADASYGDQDSSSVSPVVR